MSSISEFPEAKEPPKKLDSALLAEQDRQFASNRRSNGSNGRRVSMHMSASGSLISEDPDEEEDEELTRLTRRSSRRSIESAESPHRRLRGLKFTPVSPQPPTIPLSSSVGNMSDSALLDDDEDFKPSHGFVSPTFELAVSDRCYSIKYSFGSRAQVGGPVKVFSFS
jgi:hypothetical protein